MNHDYTADEYNDHVNFIITKMVGRSDDPQDEVNARVMLQNVIDFEPIHGDIYPILTPTDRIRRPRPSFEDVRGI